MNLHDGFHEKDDEMLLTEAIAAKGCNLNIDLCLVLSAKTKSTVTLIELLKELKDSVGEKLISVIMIKF